MRNNAMSVAVFAQCLILAILAVLMPITQARDTPDVENGAEENDVLSLVVVTEDNPQHGVNSGCDAISIHNYLSGSVVDRATKHVSPARVAATKDLGLIVAGHANGCGYTDVSSVPDRSINPNCDPWIALRQSVDLSTRRFRDGFYTGGRVANNGGLSFIDDGSLVFATSGGTHDGTAIRPRPPYGVARAVFPDSVHANGRIQPSFGSFRTTGLIASIHQDYRLSVIHLVGIDGTIHTIDDRSMMETDPAFEYPVGEAPRSAFTGTLPPVEGIHSSISRDGDYILINRLYSGDLAVADLRSRLGRTVRINSNVEFVGGVDINKGWENVDLVAIRTSSHIIVGRFSRPDNFAITGVLDAPAPILGATTHDSGGSPVLAIRWTTDGSHLITVADDGPSEFWVIRVQDDGTALSHVRSLTACPAGENAANDIWTANGAITPTSSPSPSLTPSPSPSRVATATSSPTPNAVSTATASPTRRPATHTPVIGDIYLPLALHESCDPTQVRIDVALVIDASSSMREPASPGSATTKLEAATAAVGTLLDVLALDEGDQAAIVSFNSDAWLNAPLTADRDELEEALASIEPGQQTRIDQGLEVATVALLDGATRDPDNKPVLVLLTDGRANPVPVEVAVGVATGAKAQDITIFTIGLGDDVEAEALRQMASEPSFFLQAPRATELDGAYQEVARSIPCPPSAYWGGR